MSWSPENIKLEIDASSVEDQLAQMQRVMTPEQFNRAMWGIMRSTGTHVKTILKKDIPQNYHVKKSVVAEAVKSPKVTTGALGVGCSIPLSGHRLSIGGSYSATGGRHGWGGKKGKRKTVRPYKITARIVKGQISTLPTVMDDGYPPFRNLSFSKVAFTRKTHKRKPIQSVVGVSVPQMPMNQAQDAVQSDIAKYLKSRVDARLRTLLKNGR